MFWEYLQRVSGGAGVASFTEVAHTSPSVVEGWRAGARPSAVHVISLAHGYGRPGIEALLAAGILDEGIVEDAHLQAPHSRPEDARPPV